MEHERIKVPRPLAFGRTPGQAEVRIDEARCTGCGSCVEVCFGAPLFLDDGKARVDQSRLFGCIACGACVCVCPEDCIEVEGRDFSMSDVVDLPGRSERADHNRLHAMLLARRSVRRFRDSEVDREVVEAILKTASTAPMGVPPTEVGVVVFQGRASVREFRDSALQEFRKQAWIGTAWGAALLRPFVGRESASMLRSFVGPVLRIYERKRAEGQDWFMYDAPLGMLFHAPASADSADPAVAATYSMLAAESLGLGSVMLGFPGVIVKGSKSLQKRYGIERGVQSALFVAFGYPAVRYRKAVRRRFASVRFV